MVHPEGLEPPTCRLEGGCSIQLSYGHCAVFMASDAKFAQSTAEIKNPETQDGRIARPSFFSDSLFSIGCRREVFV